MESGWLEHGHFAFWLVEATRPRRFVELGSHSGFSYLSVCQAVQRLELETDCYAVDSWVGDDHAGFYGEEIFTRLSATNDRAYKGFSTLLRGLFSEALSYFADGSIDLLHIDGRHGYNDVRADFESWRPKLSERAVVLFHDTNVRERSFGVWRLWDELKHHHPSFEFLHGHGLGVLAVGSRIPEGLRPLLSIAGEQCVSVRNAYASLGRAVSMRFELDRHLRHGDEHAREIARLGEVIAEGQKYSQRLEHEMSVKNQILALLEQTVRTGDAGREDIAARAETREREIERLGAIVAEGADYARRLEQEIARRDERSEEIERQAGDLSQRVADAKQRASAAHAVSDVLAVRLIDLRARQRWEEDQTLRSRTLQASAAAAFQAETEALRSELHAARTEIEAAAAMSASLRQERDKAREDLDAIFVSTFWRVTEPWRRRLPRHPWIRALMLRQEPPRSPVAQSLSLPAAARIEAAREPEPRLPTDERAEFRRVSQARLAEFLRAGDRLVFPSVVSAEISVVVVLWNKAWLTLRCLRALHDAMGPSLEVIVFDNGSSDETSEMLAKVDGIRVVRSETNVGFLLGSNRGAEIATGRALLLLNNDAFVRSDALDVAMATLSSASDVGAVGARLLLPSGRLQEAGSIVWSDGSCLGYGRGGDATACEAMFRRDVDFCSGAFLLTWRGLWNELGGFDEAYAPAYYEETDYCLRLQAAGYRVVYEPEAVVDHVEFGSQENDGDSVGAMIRNQTLFKERHAAVLRRRHHPPRIENALAARTASAFPRPRLLVIDHDVPLGASGAGYPRARELLAAAVRLGWSVTLFPFHALEIDWDVVRPEIAAEVEIVSRHAAPRFADFMRFRRGYYNVVLVSRPDNMILLRSILSAHPDLLDGARVIYDSEALAATREITRATLAGSPYGAPAAGAMVAEELALAHDVDAIVCVNEAEAEAFRRRGLPVHVLGHSIACTDTVSRWDERSGFLFIGRLLERDAPNWQGLAWFIKEVWPLIRAALPTATLSVVGRLHAEQAALEAPGVRLLGTVRDLAPYYAEARVFIAPIHLAAGVPLKVIEASATGLPVVGTSLMARQLDWEPDKEIATADVPGAFAAAAITLHGDAVIWAAMSAAAQMRVRLEHGPAAFKTTVEHMLCGEQPDGDRTTT